MYESLFAFFAAYSFLALAIAVVQVIAMWMLFTKAGEEGWKSIIPIYNVIVFMRIIGVSLKWYLILFGLAILTSIIPIMGIIYFIALIYFGFLVLFNIARSYDKGTGFVLGLIFLNFIFILILAFGDSKYIGNINTSDKLFPQNAKKGAN